MFSSSLLSLLFSLSHLSPFTPSPQILPRPELCRLFLSARQCSLCSSSAVCDWNKVKGERRDRHCRCLLFFSSPPPPPRCPYVPSAVGPRQIPPFAGGFISPEPEASALCSLASTVCLSLLPRSLAQPHPLFLSHSRPRRPSSPAASPLLSPPSRSQPGRHAGWGRGRGRDGRAHSPPQAPQRAGAARPPLRALAPRQACEGHRAE